MGSRDEDYKFLQIIDATASINQKVNLIGVVMETSIPKQSKGTDFFCTVRIVDESMPCWGVSVTFFSETMEKLPQVQCAGDILQLSRVVMKTHGSEVYALFNKKFSSFALFDGKHGSSFVPYQVSSKYHAREQDKKFIVGLREWMVDHENEIACSDLQSLKDIVQGDHFNVVCKILHLSEVQKDEWMLFVWDGTDTPPVVIDNKIEDEGEKPLPLQLEPFQLPRDILCTFPPVGTVLRVILGSSEKLGLNTIKTGRWVKLINLKCEVQAALWSATIMHFSKLCYLPDDNDLVLQCQRNYDERVSSKWGHMPSLSFPWASDLTATEYPAVPFVTLMHVLTSAEVTAKFKCVVRVVDIFPWLAEDFLSPDGTYRIRLTLEDPTARIHAFLFADDAVKFFGGYHPTDVITTKRNLLLGIKESSNQRNPPWVQLCLKSYYVDKADVWGSRNYRVYATRFEG